jgi:signal transduction histidine kinase
MAVLPKDIVHRVERILDGLGASGCSCHPLMAGSRPIGALGFASRTHQHFDADDVDVMQALSHQVALAYECLNVVAGLREQERNKDEFLATLAHELRTPLSAMKNGLQLLRLATDDPAMILQARSILDRQVQQMIRLVDDVTDVSRVNSNRLELRKEWVELATIIKNAVEISRPLIEASRHQLAVQLPAHPVLLDADPIRLAQALSNLLNNAAKYTEPGGHIELGAEQQGDRAIIRVRDNGMGIPPETLPHVFRMFMQARRSVERSQGGLGIGLPLVRRLVEMHGGSVSAFSEGPGKGSEFTVRLPVLALPT